MIRRYFMKNTKQRAAALILGAGFALSGLTTATYFGTRNALLANAMDTATAVTYPFSTGKKAFKNAATFTASSEQGTGGGAWAFAQVSFDSATADMTNAKYVGVQMSLSGAPGLTVGFLQGGNRWSIPQSGESKVYFQKEDGTITELKIQYGAIAFTANLSGTLFIPTDILSSQFGGTIDFTKISAFFMTANTLYNYNYSVTVGEIGMYAGEPDTTAMTKLVDLSGGERAKSKYYVADGMSLTMPSDVPVAAPEFASYPLRTGDDAYKNVAVWGGFTPDNSKDNQQTLSVDLGTADFSSAEYLVVQYFCAGAPGLQYKLKAGNNYYSVAGKEGKPVYFQQEGSAASVKACDITYAHVNNAIVGKMGALVIPMDSMAWESTAGDLSAVDSLIVTTNAKYNGNFNLIVGEIGYYSEDDAFTKVLDLSSRQDDKFSATSALEENRGSVEFKRGKRDMMGDATIDYTGKGVTNVEFNETSGSVAGIWDGGSFGRREAATDSYGKPAVKFTTLGANPAGDAYTAFDLAAAGGFSWAGMKGVSFWARNDSDTEIAFNIEVDCKLSSGLSDRFNIKQGNRFWLYDVNTGKTSIYMTRPTATLPAGFEGWVRIPFTAFARADWSTNGVTKDQFMSEGSMVGYLAITVHSENYKNKSFTVNNFGGYQTTPRFSSAFVSSNGKSIAELMELN